VLKGIKGDRKVFSVELRGNNMFVSPVMCLFCVPYLNVMTGRSGAGLCHWYQPSSHEILVKNINLRDLRAMRAGICGKCFSVMVTAAIDGR
jgi:hypothetical protein